MAKRQFAMSGMSLTANQEIVLDSKKGSGIG